MPVKTLMKPDTKAGVLNAQGQNKNSPWAYVSHNLNQTTKVLCT